MDGEKSHGQGRVRLASRSVLASSPSAIVSMFSIAANPMDGPSRSFAISATSGHSISFAANGVPTVPSEIGCRSACRLTGLMDV